MKHTLKHTRQLILLGLLFALILTLCACGKREDEKRLQLEYELSGDGEGYSVTSSGKWEGKGSCYINIPATHRGKPVTSIGDDAFCFCTSLGGVTIPDSVTRIGNSAFEGCAKTCQILCQKMCKKQVKSA